MPVEHRTPASAGPWATAAAIKAEIEMLQARITDLEAVVASSQAAFWAVSERQQAERLLAELLRMTADLMSAREAAARLEAELTALRYRRSSRPWWWRMLAG